MHDTWMHCAINDGTAHRFEPLSPFVAITRLTTTRFTMPKAEHPTAAAEECCSVGASLAANHPYTSSAVSHPCIS